MKNIYLLILLLALITLAACGISENNITYVDSVFYKDNSTIYYCDYLSDDSKPLCMRKGCKHDNNECDFFEVIKIIDSDKYVYFLRDEGFEIQDGETTLKQTISVFNKLDNTTQSLYTVNALQNNCINFHMEIYEEWLYFYRGVTIDAERKDCTLYRLNLSDGSVQKLLESETVHSYVYKDMLVYHDLNGGIYTTDLYGDNQVYVVENIDNLHMIKSDYSSEYVYYNVGVDNGTQYDLYRSNLFKGGIELVAKNVPESLYYGVALTDDRIYYHERVDNNTTRIYSCYHDGSNQSIVTEITYEILELEMHNDTLVAVCRDMSGTIRRIKLYETNTDHNVIA